MPAPAVCEVGEGEWEEGVRCGEGVRGEGMRERGSVRESTKRGSVEGGGKRKCVRRGGEKAFPRSVRRG